MVGCGSGKISQKTARYYVYCRKSPFSWLLRIFALDSQMWRRKSFSKVGFTSLYRVRWDARWTWRISPKTTRNSALLRYAQSSEQRSDFWEFLLNRHVSQFYCIIQSQMNSALPFENFPETNTSSGVQSGLVNILKSQFAPIFAVPSDYGADFWEFSPNQHTRLAVSSQDW